MKRYSFLFPLLFLLTPLAEAQQVEFAPTGAEWFYRYQPGWGAFDGFFHAENLGDTLLDGRLCKKICTSVYSQPASPPYCRDGQLGMRYIYQHVDSIFEYNPAPAYTSRLLFRTNFQVGDSLHYYYRASVVTSIDTVTLNNQLVRRFHLDDGFGNQPIIYDRFGPEDGLFDYSWGPISDQPIFHLRCYQNAHFPQIHLTNEPCDFVVSTIDLLDGFSIYPNPVHDFIYLSFQGQIPRMQYQIWDAAGGLLQDQPVAANLRIDTQSLPVGFYVLTIRAEGKKVWQKFIKQ